MEAAANDFKTIAARLREIEAKAPPWCSHSNPTAPSPAGCFHLLEGRVSTAADCEGCWRKRSVP